MGYLRVFSILLATCAPFQTSLAENWDRTEELSKKSPTFLFAYAEGHLATPTKADADQHKCSSSEIPSDKKLTFDVRALAKKIGPSFDVRKLYLGTWQPGGNTALDEWMYDSQVRHGHVGIPILASQWGDEVSACVGGRVLWLTLDSNLEKIFLWHPVEDIGVPPATRPGVPGVPNENYKVLDPVTTPIGPIPLPIRASRADLRPDFDVEDASKKEISANCDNCNGKPVRPHERIRLVLRFQVANDKLKNHKRKSSLTKVEGRVWYRVIGVQNEWRDIANPKVTIDKGNNGATLQETVEWLVPDMPGHTLQLVACVDTDDAIYEPGEGSSRRQIQRPDDCGNNNRSRIERFYIRHPVDLWANLSFVSGQAIAMPGDSVSLRVTAYASNDDAGKHQRFDADSVVAPLWFRVPSVQAQWSRVTDLRFSRGKLDKDADISETFVWKIPSFPGRNIQIATCIDADDAIREQGELVDRHIIADPNAYTGGNNCAFADLLVSGWTESSSAQESGSTSGQDESVQKERVPMSPATRAIILDN